MDEQISMDNALSEMLKSISYMVQQSLRQTTQIFSGRITADNGDGTWNIQYNGETHPIRPYGNITPSVNQYVKVFIPQGNQALSFFM